MTLEGLWSYTGRKSAHSSLTQAQTVNLTLARYTASRPCHHLSLNPDHKQPCVWLQNELQTPINQLINHLTAHYGRTSGAAESCSRMVGGQGTALVSDAWQARQPDSASSRWHTWVQERQAQGCWLPLSQEGPSVFRLSCSAKCYSLRERVLSEEVSHRQLLDNHRDSYRRCSD